MLQRVLPWCLCLGVAACSRGGGSTAGPEPVPAPSPPPGSGQVTIAMDGTWQVVDLQRVDTSAAAPFSSHPHLPFVPLHEGARLRIDQGVFVDGLGLPLFATWTPQQPNERYLNHTDGRVALFDFLNRASLECSWHAEVRAAFGSVAADEMVGEVQVFEVSTCSQPSVVRANPNGHFRLRLVRVPAGGN